MAWRSIAPVQEMAAVLDKPCGEAPASEVGTEPDLSWLEPLRTGARRSPILFGGLLTAAMMAGLVRELAGSGLYGLSFAMPRDPRFYLCIGLLYLSLPMGDFIIFRRLWRVPIDALAALIRKRIANEVVFGYSGEAYFYAWARARTTMVAAPFGAVKDVSILSALAGNAITLAMVAVALPLGHALLPPTIAVRVAGSAAAIVAICLPFLVFSRQVFSLPRRELWWVFGIHCLRLLAGSALIALAWHFALPSVPIAVWLLLAAGRLLVSRLPLVPNKDLIFASLAIVLIGQGRQLADLMALSAALTLLLHTTFLLLFGVQQLVRRWRWRWR